MPSILSGFTIGSYEILDRLKRGGMADVYLARNKAAEDPDRTVVLRMVEYGTADEDILAAERMGAALHAHLAAVDRRVPALYAHGELEDCCFFVEMEYVEGEDLDERLKRGPMPWRDACHIAHEILDLLDKAHHLATDVGGEGREGVVHGDVKPRNIRLEPDGGVRLLDFGIAKALSLTRRATHNVFASAAYAAPERLATGIVDERADLWAVGVILYEMVAGRPPFSAATTERVERQILARRPAPALPEANAPPALARLLRKALAPDPTFRYSSAVAFRADVDAVLAGADPVPEALLPSFEAEAPHGRPGAGAGTHRTAAPRNGATRRTMPAASSAGGATRRTHLDEPDASLPVLLDADPARPAVVRKGKQAVVNPSAPAVDRRRERTAPRGSRLARLRRAATQVVAGFVLMSVLGLVVLEAGVWNEARALRDDLEADRIDADAAWERYEQLDALSLIDVGLVRVRGPLKASFMAEAEDVLTDYRDQEETTVWEGRWTNARDHLALANRLDPSDDDVAARLSYVEGHLARIDGRPHEAVAAFEAASAERPAWPDPYIGLATTYLYGLRDYGAAEEAVLRLRELDYSLGKREWAVLADASYFRGLDRLDRCDGDGERDCLDEAAELFRTAAGRYERVVPMGRSVQNRRDALEQLAVVEGRKADLRRDAWYQRLRRLRLWD